VPPPRISLASWLPLSRVAPDPETPRIAARAATATTLAYVVMHGLAWPGISTILVTPVVCAQASFGASRQKALLRIVGTAFGALLGIGTTVALVPLVTSIAGLLMILVPSFWIAAWVSMGSPRIAYAGIQIALAFAMYGDAFGPGTELVMGRDRVIGIALGIVLMAALEQLLWPQYAGSQLARRLAAALRAQAGLARAAIEPLDPAVRDAPERWHTLDAYRALTVSLATIEESRFEPGGPADEAARAAALALTARAQDVMLALVTLARAGPPAGIAAEAWHELAEAQADALAAIADRLDGTRPAAVPLERLERGERALAALEAQHGADRLTLQRSLAETLRGLARSPEIERLATLAPARVGDAAQA